MSKLAILTVFSRTSPTEFVMLKFVSYLLAIVTIVPIVFAFSIAFAQPARAATPTELAGDWATPGLGAVVRLAPCFDNNERLCGRLIWAWDPSRVQRGAIGGEMLHDFVWRDGSWVDGEVFNPEEGRTYSGSIRPDGDVLRLRGCAGPFCQTQTWRRLSSIPRPTSP
jgi:Delta7-sterol 5-desaturase